LDAISIGMPLVEKFQAAQGELSGALSRLLVSVERYPGFEKRIKNYSWSCIAQLEGLTSHELR